MTQRDHALLAMGLLVTAILAVLKMDGGGSAASAAAFALLTYFMYLIFLYNTP